MKWAGPFGDRPFFYSPFLFKFVCVLNRIKMKKTIVTLLGLLMAVTVSQPVFAAEPDSPGSKMFTIQAGGLPGFGGLVSGQIAMANVANGHLYGGLQLGANFRHGAATDAKKTDLSLAPRVMLGWNLGRVVELHMGGLGGVAVQRFDELKSQLAFCYGGFGGLRLNLSDSMGIVLEGCYSNALPYVSGGLAFRF